MNNKSFFFFFFLNSYNGSFSVLTCTLFSSVKVSIAGSSSTDVYMKFRNACMLDNRIPGISIAHLFRNRDLSECCLPNCILSFSLMESMLHLTQLLLSSREDAADPCALVVIANTCIYTHL